MPPPKPPPPGPCSPSSFAAAPSRNARQSLAVVLNRIDDRHTRDTRGLSRNKDDRAAIGRQPVAKNRKRHARNLPRAVFQSGPVDLDLAWRARLSRWRAARWCTFVVRLPGCLRLRLRLGAFFGIVRIAIEVLEPHGIDLHRIRTVTAGTLDALKKQFAAVRRKRRIGVVVGIKRHFVWRLFLARRGDQVNVRRARFIRLSNRRSTCRQVTRPARRYCQSATNQARQSVSRRPLLCAACRQKR